MRDMRVVTSRINISFLAYTFYIEKHKEYYYDEIWYLVASSNYTDKILYVAKSTDIETIEGLLRKINEDWEFQHITSCIESPIAIERVEYMYENHRQKL